MTNHTRSAPDARRMLINGLASLLLTLAGFGYAWFAYEGVAPVVNRAIWGAFSVVLFGVWVAALAGAALAHRTGISRDWGPVRHFLDLGTFIGVNGVTWLFMPYGTTELQHATLLFSTSYGAATLLSSVDGGIYTRSRIVIVLGSLAAICLIERIALWQYLTIYLVILAVVLVIFDTLLRRTIASLKLARIAAEQSRDARTRFVSAATHDLGQPLQAARLFHEQALRAHTPEQREDAANAARMAFEAMERLLHAMLDHLRLSKGFVSSQPVKFEVAELLSALGGQYKGAAKLAGVDLIVLPVEMSLRADRHLCERALGNFIDNALRHGRATTVRLGAREAGHERLRLFVEDDGVGVAAADRATLFDDFVQGMATDGAGFGLGLASARRAAQAMAGVAGLDPDRTAGAHFYLELPMRT